MLNFMLIRIFRSAMTLWVVFTLVFFGARLSGDAMDFLFPEGLESAHKNALEVYYGLNGSLFEQYWKFWRGLFEGNMGISLTDKRPVTEVYGLYIGNTLRLFLSALLFSICIGIPLGVIAAVKRGTIMSTLIMSVAFLGYGVPNFILAIFLILVFSFN